MVAWLQRAAALRPDHPAVVTPEGSLTYAQLLAEASAVEPDPYITHPPGLDFAVAEECGQLGECGDYVDAFGDHVLVVEYTEDGLAAACADWGDRLSVVRRDVGVSTPAAAGHVNETC